MFGTEGTNCYMCGKCKKPTDAKSAKETEKVECEHEWENGSFGFMCGKCKEFVSSLSNWSKPEGVGEWEDTLAELLDENRPTKIRDYVRSLILQEITKARVEGFNSAKTWGRAGEKSLEQTLLQEKAKWKGQIATIKRYVATIGRTSGGEGFKISDEYVVRNEDLLTLIDKL